MSEGAVAPTKWAVTKARREENQKQLLKVLRAVEKPMVFTEIEEHQLVKPMELSGQGLAQSLRGLMARGLVRRKGSGRTAEYEVQLTPKAVRERLMAPVAAGRASIKIVMESERLVAIESHGDVRIELDRR